MDCACQRLLSSVKAITCALGYMSCGCREAIAAVKVKINLGVHKASIFAIHVCCSGRMEKPLTA